MSKEKAAEIRKILKTKGWSSRKVSVRSEPCTLSNSLRIEIKDALVPLNEVEAVAKKYQHVDRCEFSGEILCGGNTYVNVSYQSYPESVLDPYADRIVARVEAAMAKVENDHTIYPVVGEYGVCGDLVGGYDVWKKNGLLCKCGARAECVAHCIVADLASQGRLGEISEAPEPALAVSEPAPEPADRTPALDWDWSHRAY